mgnify:CR=1 FL=1
MVYKHKEDVKELGKKVDVLRLITYQTNEHDVFVRAQRKWRRRKKKKKNEEDERNQPLIEPPEICDEECQPCIAEEEVDSMNLRDLLPFISTVAADFSLPALDRLETPIKSTN